MPSPSIATILRDHVALSITCIDRLYLGGYVPLLQAPGQVATFCRHHLGAPIPSPALFRPLHDRFVHALEAFAAQHNVPILPFVRGQRKDDVAARQRARFKANAGVVFIGVAQEKASSFKAHRDTAQSGVSFTFSRQPVFVKHYYVYLQDEQWGPACIKIGTYLPFPVRLILNGHEWVKQQLRRAGVPFDSLDNGFRWCADPSRLQHVCDRLGSADVQQFFDRWVARLPWPFSARDRAAGYHHRLSIWQLEVSLTQVFDQPVYGRQFFETVIRDNLDLGRPDRVNLLFPTRLTRATPPPLGGYHTRVITAGVAPSLHVGYKHSHVKQYFKEEQALRTETTINDPKDFQPTKALTTLDHLRTIGSQINTRLLDTERLNHACVLVPTRFERLQQPALVGTQRASALRFGDARVHALLQALSHFGHVPDGFQHRDLRPLVAALLGRELAAYSSGAMTYDLRRLRLHGLIQRVDRTRRYMLTLDGWQVARFYATVYQRILQPGWAALAQPTTESFEPIQAAVRQLATATSALFERLHPAQSAA